MPASIARCANLWKPWMEALHTDLWQTSFLISKIPPCLQNSASAAAHPQNHSRSIVRCWTPQHQTSGSWPRPTFLKHTLYSFRFSRSWLWNSSGSDISCGSPPPCMELHVLKSKCISRVSGMFGCVVKQNTAWQLGNTALKIGTAASTHDAPCHLPADICPYRKQSPL